MQSIMDAKRSGLEPGQIQIACGRHCYEGFVYNENTGAIIDVTGLRAIGYDESRGYYVEVGNGNWDMYRALNNLYGLTLPAGSCYSVGLGGHITGGGYGLLSRLHGLTIDRLTCVEIVTFGETDLPQIVYASEANYQDLFFAVRGGGGGNFGIITRYYFRDPPPAPQMMYVDTLTIPWSGLSEAGLGAYLSDFAEHDCSQNPDDWHNFSIFHLNHQQAASLTKSTFTFFDERLHGDQHAFEKRVAHKSAEQRKRYEAIGPLSDLPGPHIGHPAWLADNSQLRPAGTDALRKYTYLEGTQTLNGSGPNRFGKYKSAYMNKGFPQEQVKALFEHLQVVPEGVPGSDMTASLVQIDSYGGRINEPASDQTAIPQRSAIMKLQYQTYWDNSAEVGSGDQQQEDAHLGWIRGLYSAVYQSSGGTPDPRQDPSGTVDGCYFNYCDVDLGSNDSPDREIDHAMYLYFKENYPTLREIKRRWNPKDWFRSAQSIPVD